MAINVNLCDCCNSKLTRVYDEFNYEVCASCVGVSNRFQYNLSVYLQGVGILWCNINK